MAIEIQGLEEVIDTLESLADERDIEQGLMDACFIVEGAAKEKAPKNDGGLRQSITSRVEGDKGIIYTPLEYAPYVEYGTGLFAENGGRTDVPWCYKDEKGEWHTTSGMRPQPYMRPALDENREDIKRVLLGAILND